MKAEEEEEAESSAREDPETLSGAGGVDQSVGYIIHLPTWSSCIRGKKQNWFRCGSPDHLMKDCLKDLSKTA